MQGSVPIAANSVHKVVRSVMARGSVTNAKRFSGTETLTLPAAPTNTMVTSSDIAMLQAFPSEKKILPDVQIDELNGQSRDIWARLATLSPPGNPGQSFDCQAESSEKRINEQGIRFFEGGAEYEVNDAGELLGQLLIIDCGNSLSDGATSEKPLIGVTSEWQKLLMQLRVNLRGSSFETFLLHDTGAVCLFFFKYNFNGDTLKFFMKLHFDCGEELSQQQCQEGA